MTLLAIFIIIMAIMMGTVATIAIMDLLSTYRRSSITLFYTLCYMVMLWVIGWLCLNMWALGVRLIS